MKTCSITLGEKTFEIDFPLTIGQLKTVEPAVTKILEMNKTGVSQEIYAHMITALEACLLPKYPTMNVSAIMNIRLNPAQLLDAYYTIGEEAGILKKVGSAPSGEAVAKPSQSIGA